MCLTGLLVFLGLCLVLTLTMSPYDRSLILSGRSEVVSMRLDNAEFGHLSLPAGLWIDDPEVPAVNQRSNVDLDVGTLVRIVRRGRGPVRLSFEAKPGAATGACDQGGRQVGSRTHHGTTTPVCDVSSVTIPVQPTDEPLVIALSGRLTAGEEVSQGAAARPILLEGTASLLVRHTGWITHACRIEQLDHLCDRFTANTVTLSPGNSIRMPPMEQHPDWLPYRIVSAIFDPPKVQHDQRLLSRIDKAIYDPPPKAPRDGGQGFVRIDPANYESGMMFLLSADAAAFEVTRIEGETYTVKESPVDVFSKSPVVHTLNGMLAAAGFVWWFLKIGRRDGAGGGHEACIALFLLLTATPSQAWAQQAYLRSGSSVGQAMLRARGDLCYAITVEHVIVDTIGTLIAPGHQNGQFKDPIRLEAAPEPVMLLRTSGLPPSVCPTFELETGLDEWLRTHSAAALRTVQSDGSLLLRPLTLKEVAVETLTVESSTPLSQGASGGTVLIADRPVGLLTDVTDDGRTGRVMRIDRVFERAAPHLGAAVAPVLQRGTGPAVPYEILRSNAEPVTPRNGASNLQAGPEPWRVVANGRVELVIHATGPVSILSLDTTAMADPPRSAELLGSRTPGGPWQSIASITLDVGDKAIAKRLSSTVFPYLLLRLYPTAGASTLALSRLELTHDPR